MVDVIKTSGEKESFNPAKLCSSIKKSGAPTDIADNICSYVEQKVEPNISTKQLWRIALGYLIKEDIKYAARYSLRRAILELGPTGFLFEQFIEALLQLYGFNTKRNVMMQGASGVSHEIDILAQNDETHALVEAKFRHQYAIKTAVDVVMYAEARREDVAKYQDKKEGDDKKPHEMWLITNAKFTQNAIKYGEHKKMNLIGWDYPRKNSLEDLITKVNLFPITVLPSVSKIETEKFTKKDLILVRDLLSYKETAITSQFDIPPEISRRIINEARELITE